MAEWLKAHAWKACLLERVTWVRIPLSPPNPYLRFMQCLRGRAAYQHFRTIDRVSNAVSTTSMQRRAVVAVYTRHMPSCSSIHRGEFYRGCSCPKWVRYSLNGKRHRQSADTRTWSAAEDKCIELQNQLDKGGAILIHVEPDRSTIEQGIATFIQSKESEGISP